MAVCVVAARYVLPHEYPRLLRLGIEVAVGAATYAGAVFLIFPNRVRTFRRTIRGAL
jgi:hypothetical protein